MKSAYDWDFESEPSHGSTDAAITFLAAAWSAVPAR